MTEKMKKFLEEASKDQSFIEKMNKAETPEAVIALAAEKGFALTAEDLKPEAPTGELSEDELDAVAGGKKCYCAIGGGGEKEAGKGDGVCACVVYGEGVGYLKDSDEGIKRCVCGFGGYGDYFIHND